jgi:putative ABC transport system substrate-binding protein
MLRRTALAFVVLALVRAPPAFAEGLPVVAIVKSQDLEPYQEAIAAFSLDVRAELVEYDLRGDDGRAQKAFQALREHPPALVWALGPLAATGARRELPETPLVFALVPNHEKYDLAGAQVTGISLTRTVRSQLETLRALAPAAKAVGVVYDPRSSALLVEQAGRAAQELGIRLVPAPVADAGEVGAKVNELAGKVDALWMVADRTVSTVQAFEKLLAFSQARRVPIFALSEEQVRAGALVALSPDLTAVGRQAARMTNRLLQDGLSPRALPVADPDGLALAINVTTARRLVVGCDLALDIFTFAARRHYPIKVFE